ncbi:MAG: ATP-dependent Clp protease ATP-binding subunit [Patescibacteria group bacterium]|nr:ATP-dependent Clp protease ATP-binding subunit [Patescibacteria group bacterium]
MLDKKIEYYICPVCEGIGKTDFGLSCPNCGGMALGNFLRKRFYYWGPQLGRAVIELAYLRKKFQALVNIIAFVVGLGGILSLALWIYRVAQSTNDIMAFSFWTLSDPLIFFFWLGLLADMFIYYRLSEEEKRQHVIIPASFEGKIQIKTSPENWEELKKASKKYKLDVSSGYSVEAQAVIEEAYLLADKLNHSYVTPAHLFYIALSDKEVAAMFSRLNVDAKDLLELIKKRIANFKESEQKTVISKTLKKVLIEAYLGALNKGQHKVSAKNFIIPIIHNDNIIKELLYELEIDEQKLFNVILWFIINEKQVSAYRKYRKLAQYKPSGNMNRAFTSLATPTLDQIAYDLTVAAKFNKLEFCVARGQEINQIWQQFESGASGVILTGPGGVGKKTIIDGIAQLMVREDVPEFFQDKRLIEIDATRLISGVSPAQAQGRLLTVIDEVIRAGNIILYISDIENMIGITSGEEESLDLSEVLASALERRTIFCLARASQDNYTKFIEGKSLGEIMAVIKVEEPKDNQAIQIIESKIAYYESKYKVYFSYNAIESVIKLSSQYIHDKYLPEKAIKLLELVAVRVAKERGENSLINKEDIAAIISEQTKIPVTKIGVAEGESLLHLEDKIHERMINQKEAVHRVSASLRRARAQLREDNRPIASFLFLGSTGVGKTELAKSVSEIYFGDEDYMVRIDMSEFQHQDSIKKMIGDASGNKGHLTEAVRKQPFTLILLDEIEKAHPDILNLFLQVMDDGRLTDGQGRTVDFTNSIVIATSNVGALFIQEQVLAGKTGLDIKEDLINKYLVRAMRPELINRFDGIIVFEPLSMENVVEIARLMLNKIRNMLEQKGIGFEVDEAGLRILAKEGFDSRYGARPLRRLLQDKIEDEIANLILMDNLKRRDTVVINEEASIEIKKAKKLLD